jgi:hypothetical protein
MQPQIEKHQYVWVIKLPAKNLYTAGQVRMMLDLAQVSINPMHESIDNGAVFVVPTNYLSQFAVEINLKTFFGEIEYIQS